mgnify:CR=1 FL=1
MFIAISHQLDHSVLSVSGLISKMDGLLEKSKEGYNGIV